jgi:hypothetical protein
MPRIMCHANGEATSPSSASPDTSHCKQCGGGYTVSKSGNFITLYKATSLERLNKAKLPNGWDCTRVLGSPARNFSRGERERLFYQVPGVSSALRSGGLEKRCQLASW